ncbi:MAG: prepilin-type N-terminal cleavage/methylation domain-containing protein [Sedimentisphaerales bacterium]|nr:prepilin-type N-terminal cleavage/methylation domain-containing protein [Sedimentisphaerales bacterium]
MKTLISKKSGFIPLEIAAKGNISASRSLSPTGFTLVEVMAAVTIGGFIMLVAVGTLKTITSSAKVVDTNINASSEIRFAMNLIRRDLVNFYRDDNIENMKIAGATEETSDGNICQLVFYTINRMKARSGHPEGDIYEVEYYLMQNEDKKFLMRRLWPNPNKEYEPAGILTVIAEDIEAFEVRYYNGEEWSSEWPEETRSLPQLIEIGIVGKEQSKGTPAMESIMVNLTRNATASASSSNSGQQSSQGNQGQSGNPGFNVSNNQGSSNR